MNIYGYSEVVKFINEKLLPQGYDVHEFEGVLVDSYICIAPDEKHYHFIFWEKYLNAWSSGLTMLRYSRLPAWANEKLEHEFDEEE